GRARGADGPPVTRRSAAASGGRDFTAAADSRRTRAMAAPVVPTTPPAGADDRDAPVATLSGGAPIVAAVDGSPSSRAAVETAARLGRELGAPVLFVHVRRGDGFGAPFSQR